MYAFLEAALRFAAACDAAGIAYFLGGSAATALHGEPRMTNDLDFVLDAGEADVLSLVARLGRDFEADEDALRRAARLRSSWNVFYLPDFTKIDVFFRRGALFDESEFARRRLVPAAPGGPNLWVKSPEDSILRKLLWFREGGGVSDRQWRDVVMTIAANRGRLEVDYLRTWAERLRIADLLSKAMRDGGGAGG